MITQFEDFLVRWGLWNPEIEAMLERFDEWKLPDVIYSYRPPTRPRPAAPWELRPQVASAAPMTSWQRCPERHRARESKQRWQREGA